MGRGRGLPAAFGRRRFGIMAAAILMPVLALGGCAQNGQVMNGPVMMASLSGGSPTIAFESIDGPPESIFHKLVEDLSDEAARRQVAVVSREAPAQYRVRAYFAAVVEHRRAAVISWVWDVYDANQQRSLRITGEEPASSAGRGTWAAADDEVLRRIARNGMDKLAAFLAEPGRAPGIIPAPSEPAPVVAANEEAGAASNDRGAADAGAKPDDGAPRPTPAGAVAALAYSARDR
jgi:hypothetical protein